MIVSLHQPYFAPHFAYFQQIAHSDLFLLHDTQMIKGGYVNRNKVWNNQKNEAEWFTLPLKKHSSTDLISEVKICRETLERKKPWLKLEQYYSKCPQFDDVMRAVFPASPLFVTSDSLYDAAYFSLHGICQYLGIAVPKHCYGNEQLSGVDKVIKTVKYYTESLKENYVIYLNSQGGRKLYKREDFYKEGINLKFFRGIPPECQSEIAPGISSFGLSTLDTLMRYPKEQLMEWVHLGAIES